MKKMIITKSLGCYVVTTLRNYNSYVQDTRLIQRLPIKEWGEPQEVVDYYCKYCNCEEEDFIIAV